MSDPATRQPFAMDAEDDESAPASSPARSRRSGRKTTRAAWWFSGGLILFSGLLESLKNLAFLSDLAEEWWIWQPMLHVAGVLLIVGVCGVPRRPAGWLHFAFANGLLLIMDVLQVQQDFDIAWFRSLEFVFKAGWTAVWVWAIVGWVFALWCLRAAVRGKRRPRLIALAAKVWLAAAMTLLVAEPLCARLVRTVDVLTFPTALTDPAAGQFRLAAIGGSTMAGYPYEPKFGIAQVAAWHLQSRLPGREVVVENLAFGGHHLRKAIGELKRLKTRPHVLLLYSGHNEFVQDVEEMQLTRATTFRRLDRWMLFSPAYEFLSTYVSRQISMRELRAGRRTLVEPAWSTPLALHKRLERFRNQLGQLAEFCSRERVETIWFVPAASESGFEPSRSTIPDGVSQREIARLEREYADGRALQRRQAWPDAVDCYQELLARYPTFAEFHFQLAECLTHMDRFDEAREHYAMALEHDAFPMRALREYRQCVIDVAAEHSIPVIDAAGVLRPHTASGILDSTIFHDNVHPTLRGYFWLGSAVAERIAALLPAEFETAHATPDLEAGFPQVLRAVEFSSSDLATAYERMAGTMEFLAKQRFDKARRAAQAARFTAWAQGLRQGLSPGEQGTEPLPE